MTSSPVARHISPRTPLTEEGKKCDAIATLEAALVTVERRRPLASPWECFHFRCGLQALLAGNYKKVWTKAEEVLVPFAERSVASKADMRKAGAFESCACTTLRQELADVKAEVSRP